VRNPISCDVCIDDDLSPTVSERLDQHRLTTAVLTSENQAGRSGLVRDQSRKQWFSLERRHQPQLIDQQFSESRRLNWRVVNVQTAQGHAASFLQSWGTSGGSLVIV